ncbi:inner membrane protein [Acinetobacter calcoaceticus]|uniref:Inner membrane protein n=1 Tax=Acinetobacter calcoaceticus TaxID=471 RepID=A0A4R1X793_ACICA|nr:inner membrane protein [Acinetobacter calcoaceticus]
MFIAHIPAGYLFAKAIYQKVQLGDIRYRSYMWVMCVGAVFPDIDLFYFFLIDNQSVHHHKYFLHWPIFWLSLFLIFYLYALYRRYRSKVAILGSLFCAVAILHVLLDTLVGDIWWFAPLINQPYALFEVTARYKPWWLNFIFHWSFVIEMLICLAAFVVYRKSARQ